MKQTVSNANMYLESSALRYLMRADEAERKRWGNRAVELGFPEEKLNTDNHAINILPWIKFIEEEMRDNGLITNSKLNEEVNIEKIVQLPQWPEQVRAIPNDILRSALFAAIQGKTRRFIKDEVIASADGITIRYNGEQLDQSDLDVWEQIIHLARYHPLGTVCTFKGGTFLKSIGRKTGKSDYQWLDSVILRLKSSAIIFHTTKKRMRGLVASAEIDEIQKTYKVTIDPDTARLYTAGWTGINWEQRQLLRGKPLTLWLQGYYASHSTQYSLRVETLHKLCGSENRSLKSFRAQLRKSLNDLKSYGVITEWFIDPKDDLVDIKIDEVSTS